MVWIIKVGINSFLFVDFEVFKKSIRNMNGPKVIRLAEINRAMGFEPGTALLSIR